MRLLHLPMCPELPGLFQPIKQKIINEHIHKCLRSMRIQYWFKNSSYEGVTTTGQNEEDLFSDGIVLDLNGGGSYTNLHM